MTSRDRDDRDRDDDDRRAVGTPMFSVREGVLPLPGPRATTRTARKTARPAAANRGGRVWDDLAEDDAEDMENVA